MKKKNIKISAIPMNFRCKGNENLANATKEEQQTPKMNRICTKNDSFNLAADILVN